MAVTPDGTRALVSGFDNNQGPLCVIDLARNPAVEIARIFLGGYPTQIAITPDGSRAVVGNMNTNDVYILDLTNTTPTIIRKMSIGYPGYAECRPYAVGITPDSKYAIITGGGIENSVMVGKAYILNLETYNVDYNITIDRFPIGMCIDPNGKTAVITTIHYDEYYNSRVSILDLTTTPFSLKASVVVGQNPGSEPAISANGKYAVVANADSNNVSIIDLTQVLQSIT